jgi:hypothetical protein
MVEKKNTRGKIKDIRRFLDILQESPKYITSLTYDSSKRYTTGGKKAFNPGL